MLLLEGRRLRGCWQVEEFVHLRALLQCCVGREGREGQLSRPCYICKYTPAAEPRTLAGWATGLGVIPSDQLQRWHPCPASSTLRTGELLQGSHCSPDPAPAVLDRDKRQQMWPPAASGTRARTPPQPFCRFRQESGLLLCLDTPCLSRFLSRNPSQNITAVQTHSSCARRTSLFSFN